MRNDMKWQHSGRLREFVGRLTIGVGLVGLIAFVVSSLHVTFNFTDSLPVGFYSASPLAGSVHSGDIVEVCAPQAIARLGLQRRYLSRGGCSTGTAYLLKIAVATSGDRIALREDGVYVNGKRLPGSKTLAKDRIGRPMPHVARGAYVLEADQIWLWTPNPHSWDSRYYGPVRQANIAGIAKLILPIGAWPYLTERV